MNMSRHDEPRSAASDQLDPREAAALLEDAQHQARHTFNTRSPLLAVLGSVVILGAYGTIWLSVRHQAPYVGPTAQAIGIVYALVAVSVVVNVTMYRRATSGVTGRSRHADTVAALAVAVPWIAVYVFMGALSHDGFDHALVYGVFDAAAPWLVVGAAVAGLAAARENWGTFAGALLAVAIGTGAAFAGPANVWGVLALCGSLALVVLAVFRFASLRHA